MNKKKLIVKRKIRRRPRPRTLPKHLIDEIKKKKKQIVNLYYRQFESKRTEVKNASRKFKDV